jgi:Malectin domain
MISPVNHTSAIRFRRLTFALAACLAVLGPSGTGLAASPAGDVVGKVTVGYQGWFACVGDGAPINSWWHYSGTSTPPTPVTLTNSIHCWPDLRQFSAGYQTGFTNFGNGQPALLFSSYDQQTVNTHFRWMAENGIDTAALQRFNPTGGEGPTRNDMAVKVRNAAESQGVKFYIMYDVSGWSNMAVEMPGDWTNVMLGQLHITNSPAYARQNGQPVVCLWGFGFNDANHPWDATSCVPVINWFKQQGCYVIGGVPTWWRTGISDSRSNFLAAYSAFNMLSPWMVGRIGNTNDSDWFRANANTGDAAYCLSNGIDYQPCVLPGDTGQRAHGDFMWRQFANLIQVGAQGLYISMFDEFNEGNQIACTAEDASMEPAGSASLYFTLDQDGVRCSSDYYLRLTGDGGRMLKGQIPFTFTRPTVPMLPLAYPGAPARLAAVAGNTQAALAWTPVTGAADVSSYNVKRSLTNNGVFPTIATNVGLAGFIDTHLANGTTYYYAVSAVNPLGESSNSAPVAVTPQTSYQVDSGGSAASPFTADAWFAGGSTSSTPSGIDTSGVTNPAPQAVYQTERYGNFAYTFTNLAPGINYRVRLHFAEIYYNAAGVRAFNVSINGLQVLTNYDVFADAGVKNKATLKEFTAQADGAGHIVIQYANIPGKDNAKSSGIEILPLPAPTIASASFKNGALQMTLSGLAPGATAVLQASSNLTDWVSLQTNPITGPTLSLTNSISPSQPKQFFKSLER